ncbi:hypothetical protein [Stratiformator vulcanicus]|uniref:Uncharacterized protein n=1 Tax=Stratiformator vulcanicus TaxID=2527980 RepID=A0A517QZ77_9PLAN|nr:hypothetical protein [Stratiformator vulcanicus]QDT36914.1 hypothetical protein Pan189_12780 [Stratiformator vulcanicus]
MSATRNRNRNQNKRRRSGSGRSKPSAEQQLFTTTQQREAAEVFDLQMWCWGCDIKRKEGNLLAEFGLTRRKPLNKSGKPDPKISSGYHGFHHDLEVALWGWGVLASHQSTGTLFIRRDGFQPRLIAPIRHDSVSVLADVLDTSIDDLNIAHRLSLQLLEFFTAYETWALLQTGEEHRSLCESERNKKWSIAACDLATFWQDFRNSLANGGAS